MKPCETKRALPDATLTTRALVPACLYKVAVQVMQAAAIEEEEIRLLEEEQLRQQQVIERLG